MLRNLLTLIALVALVTAKNLKHHQVFRIVPESEDQLKILRESYDDVEGFDFWKTPSFVLNPVDLMVAPEKLTEFAAHMESLNIKYDTFIDDVQAKLEVVAANKTRARAGGFSWTSYHNLEEIYSFLDSLAERYPNNAEVIIGGKSYEGRQIKGMKLTFGENKPGIFIEGGIHAREWISPATVTYLINQLLTSSNSEIRELAKAHDWYIFPVFNPDGYAFTHINPRNANYRLWRKNRSPNKGFFPFQSCYGTDMNRNWNYEWMTIGASDNSCSESYAGAKPFSEVETETLSNYISSLSDKLFAYVAFHSYSQFLMFPYGHTKSHLDNYDEQLAIGKVAVKALSKRYGTYYKTGNIGEVIGYASGGSLDWVKAKLKLPLVYIYELRDRGNYGFLLPPNQIIPNSQEIMDSLIALFKEAKKFGYPKSN